MILSAQSIRSRNIITPFFERTVFNGMSFGLSSCGYDLRVAQEINLDERMFFTLASTLEHFNMPNDIVGRVCDKSSLARRGLAVQNTIVEPGWRGYLTLELSNNWKNNLHLSAGSPIAQVVFEYLDEPTEQPYAGKYQDQEAMPVRAKYEKDTKC